MSMDDFLDGLTRDLTPVRRRRLADDAALLAGLCGLELALFLAAGMARPDLMAASGQAAFWWKVLSLGLLAGTGLITALRSFDPTVSPRRGLLALLGLFVLALGGGWLLDATLGHGGDLWARLDWRDGLKCFGWVFGLSAPAILLLAWLVRRGAPTQPRGAALAAGVGAAAWGAFVFVFACPHNDPLYVAVWYSLSCGLDALLVRFLLPRLGAW
jgi:hypothetical protein